MIRLEPLTGDHDRNAFDCGIEALDKWLRQIALQHQRKGISRSFVAVPNDDQSVAAFRNAGYEGVGADSILGFYAMASAHVSIGDLPAGVVKRYPRRIPVTRLGRLATRIDMQGQGLGRLLLADAVNRAKGAAQAVGSAGIIVDAKRNRASRFYQAFGFRLCEDQPLILYLPMWSRK
ncbi:GNAT family N-acetyltransferase [Candidatus Thiosymbion oneisti]|uniref:GNAT family N-acetyltransferase n=1 Tax=Candidatus Thiosymbion oneisti TaxID=589554 RepID=UPI000B7C9F89|nr:GNAT family N-acetyltransferase [Candidatus Thiosymbion oneisti]